MRKVDERQFDEITRRRKEIFARGRIHLVGNRMTGHPDDAEEYNRLAAIHSGMMRS